MIRMLAHIRSHFNLTYGLSRPGTRLTGNTYSQPCPPNKKLFVCKLGTYERAIPMRGSLASLVRLLWGPGAVGHSARPCGPRNRGPRWPGGRFAIVYLYLCFNLSFSGDIPVTFTNTTADVANVADNSLHLIGFCTSTNFGPTLSYNSRMRFVG